MRLLFCKSLLPAVKNVRVCTHHLVIPSTMRGLTTLVVDEDEVSTWSEQALLVFPDLPIDDSTDWQRHLSAVRRRRAFVDMLDAEASFAAFGNVGKWGMSPAAHAFLRGRVS